MFKLILSWLTGGGISAIGEQINKWHEIKLKAQTDHEKLEADKVLSQLEKRRDVLVAGRKVAIWVQAAWALPFLVYDYKLIIWDKVLGWGVTDPLSADLMKLQWIIVGFFFLTIVRR